MKRERALSKSLSGRRLTAAFMLLLASSLPIAAQDAMIRGEVKKVDEAAGKITLKHGPIKALGMDEPSMTMVFHVKDPSLLKQVKVGDKVQFEVGEDSEGLAVTRLEKSK